MELKWKFDAFNDLSPSELYAIMKLRSEVFVVEQNCVYLDADGKDEQSFHVGAWLDNDVVAYCRVLPPGLSYPEASIGRVATSIHHRKAGYGRELIKLAIDFTFKKFDCKKITIGAQYYLKDFYGSFGFVQKGDIYPEDNIPHIRMSLDF